MWRTDSVHARLRFRKNSLFAAKVIMVDILTDIDASATSATRANLLGGSNKDSRSSGHEPRRRIEESRPEFLPRACPSPPHFLHTRDWLHDVQQRGLACAHLPWSIPTARGGTMMRCRPRSLPQEHDYAFAPGRHLADHFRVH